MDIENQRIQIAINELVASDKVLSMTELNDKFNTCNLKPKGFYQLCEQNITMYISLRQDSAPTIDCSVTVYSDLTFIVHRNGIKCKDDLSKVMQDSTVISSFSDFVNLLSYLNGLPNDVNLQFIYISKVIQECVFNSEITPAQIDSLRFLSEQFHLLACSPNRRRYQVDTLVKSIVWQNHSSSCYKSLINEGLILPSLRTIQRITTKFQTDNADRMISYLIHRRASLNQHESIVCLIFDEVYIYQHLDYSNGKFIGLTSDGQPATTVLTFMIKSLSSKFCDVISFTPLHGVTADILYDKYEFAMELCRKAGFFVLVVISDNHPANRKCLTSFICAGQLKSSISHPHDDSKRLHLLIDPTHNMKNLFNNFQRNETVKFAVDETASFKHIKELYDIEKNIQLRMAHRLFPAVLSPTSIQRASCKLSCALFHESTAAALEFYVSKGKTEWTGTAKFIRYISDLWKIINVKTSTIGIHKRDPLLEPVRSISDMKLLKLIEFQSFFESMRGIRDCGVSRETIDACILMCSSLRAICESLFNDHHYSFVLLGHAQSDPLEQRFGRLRQMSGANFFIGYKQLLEGERRIKIVSLLKHSGINVRDLNDITDVSEADDSSEKCETVRIILSYLESHSPDDLHLESNELNLLYFVSGYIAKVVSVPKCENCRDLLLMPNSGVPEIEFDDSVTEFLRNISRGGLKSPSVYLFSAVSVAYKCFSIIKDSREMFLLLLNSKNARNCFQEVCCKYLISAEFLSQSDSCADNHPFLPLVVRSLGCLFNILSKKLYESSLLQIFLLQQK